MNLGIQVENTSAGTNSVETAAAGTAASTSSGGSGADGVLFGRLMAKAMQLQAQAGTTPGQAEAAAVTATLGEGGLAQDMSNFGETDAPDEPEDLALALPKWLQPWSGMPSVQQITVGPSLQAITAGSATPDASSVAAFARQQGLDADTIAWLMNPHGATLPNTSGDTALGQAAQTLAMQVPGAASTLLQTGTPVGPMGGHSFQSLASLALRSGEIDTGLQTGTAQTQNSTPDPASDSVASMVLTQMRWSQANAAATTGQARLTPQAIAMGQSSPVAVVEGTLDLSAWFTLEDGKDLLASPEQSGTEGAGSGVVDVSGLHRTVGSTAHTRNEAANPTASSSSLTSDQMEQMSEQMADAIGERMLREIERGHWSLRLMLKPAHLGHIEVEMRLRAGELDATFAAPQAATRELLQDGLARLKDSLGQAGMDVANLHVKDGQNRQNGGDSTPGQRQFAHNAKNTAPADAAVPNTESTPRPRRSDGWDVMV